jgi:hypothetical protein
LFQLALILQYFIEKSDRQSKKGNIAGTAARMEKPDQDKTAQSENCNGSSIERKSERVSEYHFFIKRDKHSGNQEVSGKEADVGEKKESEKDRSVAFFLSES